jgi:hypothetical protein
VPPPPIQGLIQDICVLGVVLPNFSFCITSFSMYDTIVNENNWRHSVESGKKEAILRYYCEKVSRGTALSTFLPVNSETILSLLMTNIGGIFTGQILSYWGIGS